MERLKPCPFCGGKVSITYNSGENAFAVWHTKEPCFIEPLWISGDDAKTLNEAYAFWNRRDDVPDRKFGEWMAEPNCWYRCSNCGQHYPSIRGYMDYKYCPTCGAQMERSEE